MSRQLFVAAGAGAYEKGRESLIICTLNKLWSAGIVLQLFERLLYGCTLLWVESRFSQLGEPSHISSGEIRLHGIGKIQSELPVLFTEVGGVRGYWCKEGIHH